MLNFTDNSENVEIQTERVKDTNIVISHKTKNIDLEFDYELVDRVLIRHFIDSFDIEGILKDKGLSYKKFENFNDEDCEIDEYSRIIAEEINKLDYKYNHELFDFWEVCDQTRKMFPDYKLIYSPSVCAYDVLEWRSNK